jgi:uncharacterized repeat protein (TIGR03803 family)
VPVTSMERHSSAEHSNRGSIQAHTSGPIHDPDAFRGAEGAQPQCSLVLDSAGNLYRTTIFGGGSDAGVIFKLDAAGNYTVLHSFDSEDGEGPDGDLIRDSAGNLYGTAYEGGDFDSGVVFKLTP